MQSAGYLIYPEADFEAFRPIGVTHSIDGVKFGTEEMTEDPLLYAKFHPIGAKGYRTPKTEIFTEI